MTPTDAGANRRGLSRKLLIGLVTPVVLLVAVGGVLALQNERMAENSAWVDHTDQVIGKAYELQKRVLDQETAIRGFLLTSDRTFLAPFVAARPLDSLAELRALVDDSPDQVMRAEELTRLYTGWLDELTSIARGDGIAEARALPAMVARREHMLAIRAVMDAMQAEEEGNRRERTEALQAANTRTKIVFVTLFAAAAAALAFLSRRQLLAISASFGEVLDNERDARSVVEVEEWLRTGRMRVSDAIQGEATIDKVGQRALRELAMYVGADVGAFYAKQGDSLHMQAGYSLDEPLPLAKRFRMGQGLVGQTARDNELRHIAGAPAGYLTVRSGTGDLDPGHLVLVPAAAEGEVEAVLELGFLRPVDARALKLLRQVGETIAIAVRSAAYKLRLRDLIDETQRQSDELQAQQEELRAANDELQQQSGALQESQRRLELQQSVLEQTNESLHKQATLLEAHNDALLHAQSEVAERASEVVRANRYKSEFLANMSHELRTPLNSALILAKLLADNPEGNLSAEQVKFALTIYGAGNDLLTLINDILDLSKIEAGKMDVHLDAIAPSQIVAALRGTFEPIARAKGVELVVHLSEAAPASIETDMQRVEQILRNLLSNAFKFTSRGAVTLHVTGDEESVVFDVRDTGIGIGADQLDVIFDAFRQADGTTNRTYGGTGLGLSISRELAQLLGGELRVSSVLGAGSSFTLRIPRVHVPAPSTSRRSSAPAEEAAARLSEAPRRAPGAQARAARPSAPSEGDGAPRPSARPRIGDDPAELRRQGRLVLVVEDDARFASILVAFAHERGFECVVADTADEGLSLAHRLEPSALLLDVSLPDHSGLSVLDRLKRDKATRHIPVHVLSADDHAQASLSMGAVGYMQKPVDRERLMTVFAALEQKLTRTMRRVLIVEDDEVQRDSMCRLLAGDAIETVAAGTVREALELLRAQTFDCVVTDLGLPDAPGDDLLEAMALGQNTPFPPVIVYTGRQLTSEEEQRLRKHSDSIIVKGARSPERLLDEVALFLHQVESELPPQSRILLGQSRSRDAPFEGRTILVVEDDVRNLFALTSILEPKGAKVVIGRNGREAIDRLEENAQIDVVLMDIMMPEMDGIEALREIRKHPKWLKLPVIALTAKAMLDDQERCLAAGANDFVSKPIDVEMLLSLLRVWMPR